MQVGAMYWLTNLQHLFIQYCLKLNDKSAESISQFWSFDREWIKEEAIWSSQQCVVNYLKLNPFLFSDTLL